MLKKIGDDQFGSIPGFFNTHALLSVVHSWTKQTDGTGSTVRIVLLDYRKAFDLVDHTILARKVLDMGANSNLDAYSR